MRNILIGLSKQLSAKRQVPELTFDIYGEGSEKTRLRKIIDTHRAQDYIRLLGMLNLMKFILIMSYFLHQLAKVLG